MIPCPAAAAGPGAAPPSFNAFAYGLLYGPIALPCSGPLVVGIFAYSLAAGEVLGKLSVFLWFGLGFGVPLLGLSLLSGVVQRGITRWFARHSRAANLVGGLLLVGNGIYDHCQLGVDPDLFRCLSRQDASGFARVPFLPGGAGDGS
ncbi:MAG: hypothetical protein JXB85_09895 [Anaerolineales bacterium]|nr:hypothetical protein [Anaerolineales bacterium]